MSSWYCEDRDAERDRRDPGQPHGLFSFLLQEGEGEVDALDLTKPSLALCAGAAGQQVVLDLVESGQHLRVDVKHWATQSCIRCPLLRPDPAQMPRLQEIRDNLTARIGVQLAWPVARPAVWHPDRRDRVDQREQQLRVVGIRG
jgi:hypothetical protein